MPLTFETKGIVGARSGEEGLSLARERKPDLVTLDVLMPGMSGWATLKALKLGRIGKSVELKDSEQLQGQLRVVSHLVEVDGG